MSVFIISAGEKYEGSSTLAVASTLEKAMEIAQSEMNQPWVRGEWTAKLIANDQYRHGVTVWLWENGCDLVKIEKREVV